MRVRFEPFGVTVETVAGQTLLQAAAAAGVEIESVCGGRGTCAKCKVIVTRGVTPPTALEERGLTADERTAGYRLACQARLEADTEVVVPEETHRARVSILSEGIATAWPLDPWVRRETLRVPPATLADQLPDWENLCRHWAGVDGGAPRPTLHALRALPAALRGAGGELTLVQVDDRLVDVAAGGSGGRLAGIAFDIGTTTVVGYLLDLGSGETLAVASRLNPQTRYGDDVVSRIDFSAREPDGLAVLQREIVAAMNEIIAEACASAGLALPDVLVATVVGNTTMHHLLLGLSPVALAQAPYVPATRAALTLPAHELGLAIHPEGRVSVLPNIAGWVGADTVGVILATDLHRHDELALAIDIGTNGEMALGSRGRLLACSTAAGPAFEGAHLSCGMRAADGAIDWVEMDGDVDWRTIGGAAPRGVCGSGLVDLVAAMLRHGVIEASGMMRTADELAAFGEERLAARVIRGERGREFVLVSPQEGAGGRAVRVTQRDVRELQLAKGAIRAGIEIMMKELGVGPGDVRRVYLAGAFGNYIRPASALAIGLMPAFPNAEVVPVGNAAGSGARLALLSRTAREEATRILDHVEYLELSGRPDFQDEFVEAMLF